MCAQADYCLANVDVDDEGAVMISGKDQEQMDACAAKILELTAEDARGGGSDVGCGEGDARRAWSEPELLAPTVHQRR